MANRPAQFIRLLPLLLLFVFLVMLFLSRRHYQQGLYYSDLDEHDKALACFNRADTLFSLADHQRLNTQRAKALYGLGEGCRVKKNDAKSCYRLFEEGRRYASAAVEADPSDYFPAYWLARIEAALELLFPEIDADGINPYRADPLFQKALLLRPAGVTIRYHYAEYLYRLGRNDELGRVVTDLVAIYPDSYRYIKKAPFFSETLYPHLKKGLAAAVDKNLSADKALSFLIKIARHEKDYGQALKYYLRKMESASPLTEKDFFQMGRMYLKTGQVDRSYGAFKKGLESSDNYEAAVKSIYAIFSKEKQPDAFIRLAGWLEESGPSSTVLKRCLATSLMKTDRPEQAKEILSRLADEQSDPLSFYLLARIAKEKGRWGEMELAARKAAALDKANPYYLLLCAEALQIQEKYKSAEEVATTIIDRNMPVGHLGFTRRAVIRWLQGKDLEAIDDWRRSFDLADEADKALFLYYISRAYYRQGFIAEARKEIDRALEMEPKNSLFAEWKTTIEK